MFFYMIWKVYLLNSVLGNVNGYFLEQSNSQSQADIYYFDNLDKAFDSYSSYEKRLLIAGFNTEASEPRIDSFVYEHELHSVVKENMFQECSQP